MLVFLFSIHVGFQINLTNTHHMLRDMTFRVIRAPITGGLQRSLTDDKWLSAAQACWEQKLPVGSAIIVAEDCWKRPRQYVLVRQDMTTFVAAVREPSAQKN